MEKVFIIKLAPIDLMPHTVHWFLEKVDHKLYDKCSFHRNAQHVIQGGPWRNFMTPEEANLHGRFEEEGFQHVAFQEYSEYSPHVKYSLGLAGRPGGPDFYVSVKDNTINHGPGGTEDNPIEPDPCFAKVVEGFDVVDRMHRSPVKDGEFSEMQDTIAITSMRILQDYQKTK
jgi:cyclophilin family peptidyl-prolyl cis-trans isomerase